MEPGVSAVHNTKAVPGLFPARGDVADPAVMQISVPAFGIGGEGVLLVISSWLLLRLPQVLLTVQVKVYTVFGKRPVA